jgi:pyrimidine-nucleoside phosphorylase
VGNALELREAIDTLRNDGPDDFREHCLVVASHLLVIGEQAADLKQGRSMAEKALADGSAWETFRKLIIAQGGDVRYVDEPERLPRAPFIETLSASRGGYLLGVNARDVGETAVVLGAGRERKGEPIDHAVGIIVHGKVGDRIEEGQPLFTIHANDPQKLTQAKERLLASLLWSSEPCQPLPLFYDVIQ